MIYIVDDEIAIIDGVVYFLQLEGFEVKVLQDAASAFRYLERMPMKQGDIILIDLRLPLGPDASELLGGDDGEGGGRQLLEKLLTESYSKFCNRIAIFTSSADYVVHEEIGDLLSLGEIPVIHKRLGLGELLTTVKAMVRRLEDQDAKRASLDLN